MNLTIQVNRHSLHSISPRSLNLTGINSIPTNYVTNYSHLLTEWSVRVAGTVFQLIGLSIAFNVIIVDFFFSLFFIESNFLLYSDSMAELLLVLSITAALQR